MNKPAIVCFSHNDDNLDHLRCELNKYYGITVDQYTFSVKESLIDAINAKNICNQQTKLFVIDLNDSNSETIGFIDQINFLCPSSIKIIIADNHHLDEIQQLVNNNSNLQYLNHPWSTTVINYALKLAFQSESDSDTVQIVSDEELIFNEKVEEKVNDRLRKLIDSNMAKDSFMSIIAHDLKSPFTALLGISEVLLNDWEDLTDENKLDLIKDLHKTSDDTYKLLLNLLEWAKLQKEKLEVSINEVLIHNLVDTSIKVNETNASVKGIKIQNKIDDKIKVNADENMMATVFRNLISNAVKSTLPGGSINISAKEEKDFCTFCVSDNGSGIDKPHILEVFNQGNRKKLNGNAKAFKGLGLILCKDFVEKNGGQIWLETQKGEGSKFYFTVPC
jgi:two-component system, sensor histidine kinase and response regulator